MWKARLPRLRTASAACAAAVVLVAATGCGGSGDSSSASSSSPYATKTSVTDLQALAAAAKKEGSVTMYGSPGADKITAWVKPFEQKYGVQVKYYRAPTSTVFTRYSQEESAGKNLADLLAISVPEDYAQAIDKGWITKYVPQARSKLGDDWVTNDTVYALYIATQAIIWNTKQVTPAEQAELRTKGLPALLDPKWKGKLAVTSAESGGPQLGGYWEITQDPSLGWNYLENLNKQDPTSYLSSITMAADLATGEYAIGLGGSDTGAWPEIQKGSPLGFAYYKDTVSSAQSLALSTKAPHPAAARLFMEWAMSKPAQQSLVDISGGLSSRTDIPAGSGKVSQMDGYAPPPSVNNKWASDPDLAKNADQFVQHWVSIFGHAT